MKKVYEEPSVKKVEFEFNERIAASGCSPYGYIRESAPDTTGCSA